MTRPLQATKHNFNFVCRPTDECTAVQMLRLGKILIGNISQIDTPYLTEGSSGITYVVDRFKGWPHSGHVTLQRGERSRLADHAAEIL